MKLKIMHMCVWRRQDLIGFQIKNHYWMLLRIQISMKSFIIKQPSLSEQFVFCVKPFKLSKQNAIGNGLKMRSTLKIFMRLTSIKRAGC